MLIMRATLHQHASNTYSGQWPRLFPEESGAKIDFIAHNGFAARDRIDAVDCGHRDFPANHASCRRTFDLDRKENRRGFFDGNGAHPTGSATDQGLARCDSLDERVNPCSR